MTMIDTEVPWVALDEVCHLYGCKFESAKMQVRKKTFTVNTYLVGRKIVIDKEVHRNYFLSKRASGLSALNSTLS
jgi:hypothetical protein